MDSVLSSERKDRKIALLLQMLVLIAKMSERLIAQDF